VAEGERAGEHAQAPMTHVSGKSGAGAQQSCVVTTPPVARHPSCCGEASQPSRALLTAVTSSSMLTLPSWLKSPGQVGLHWPWAGPAHSPIAANRITAVATAELRFIRISSLLWGWRVPWRKSTAAHRSGLRGRPRSTPGFGPTVFPRTVALGYIEPERCAMLMTLRHLLAILLLPFVVVVVVPCWLAGTVPGDTRWVSAVPAVWVLRSAGILLLLVGFALFASCVILFARVGRGTLAPWDPTRNLVAVGPYRFVRNPMISGVALMLAGETLLWGSWVIGLWACAFVLINHVYFILSEEPGLERRFGEGYRAYKRNVPRWVPRARPWSGE
jgi:protein-S-isoprenylcysteine O-methyltransferase Ste14